MHELKPDDTAMWVCFLNFVDHGGGGILNATSQMRRIPFVGICQH